MPRPGSIPTLRSEAARTDSDAKSSGELSQQVNSTTSTDVRRSILVALGCAYIVLLFCPWRFFMPQAGLDASWIEVIGYGARQRWQWGRDIVFTYGPLGFLLPNPYRGGANGTALALNTFLALAFGQGLMAVLPREPSRWSIGLFVLIAFPAAMMERLAFTVFGLLAALLYFRRPGAVWHWRASILAAAAGVFAMVYISSGALGLGIFLLLDISRLTHRRRPVFLPVFVVAAAISYLSAGQDATRLPQFLRGSIELISGYAGAMSLVGNRLELAAFLPMSALVFAGVLWSEQARLRRKDDRWDAVLLVAVVALVWFVSFKRGFVRHDLHSLSAWQTLAMAAAAYAAMRWSDPESRGVRWLLVGLSMAACVASIFAWDQSIRIASVGRQVSDILIRQPVLALEEAMEAVVDSAEWRRALLERRMRALSEIRAAVPLPRVRGSVDVIPNVQSAVLAHGLSYRPRPVFQDYAAYTPWLMDLNRAHYRSAQAADYVLFRPDTIDGRYPLLDQGTTVNELLTLYDPIELEHDLLVLKRRLEPLSAVMVNTKESTATAGEWVSLETDDRLVMLSVTPSLNLLSRLTAFFFRPPILALSVRLADGSEHKFRLIEGIARSGFLLSPLVENSLAFAAAATDRWEAVEHLRVLAFRISTFAESSRRLYGDAFSYSAAVLRLDGGKDRALGGSLRTAFRRQALSHSDASSR
jgi:hypothetical protein